MGQTITRYQGDNSHVGPSPIIWGNVPEHTECLIRPELGRSVWHDFMSYQPRLVAASNVAENGELYARLDTGVTLQGEATIDTGLVMAHDGSTDNDEGVLSGGGNTGVCGIISTTAGVAKKLCFEMSVAKNTVANNGLMFFAGLSEEGLAAAETLVDDTGALASKDFIGFSNLADDGDSLDVVYRKAGQALTAVEDAAYTLVADTYYKLGMVYDPAEDTDHKITFYIDGVDICSYVTAANLAAATFPLGEELTWLFATKIGEAAAAKAYIRWIRFYQER